MGSFYMGKEMLVHILKEDDRASNFLKTLFGDEIIEELEKLVSEEECEAFFIELRRRLSNG